jgi:hypothetical protein
MAPNTLSLSIVIVISLLLVIEKGVPGFGAVLDAEG